MRNSKIRLAITVAILAGTVGATSAFAADSKGQDTTSSENMQGMEGMKGMEGMEGMMGMMKMMSSKEHKAMANACLAMMQNHGGDGNKMSGAKEDKTAS